MDYEFLIVGKGITGSILANNLANISDKFKIINYENVNSSSRVAAGIMHPMALKRGTLSWREKNFLILVMSIMRILIVLMELNFIKNTHFSESSAHLKNKIIGQENLLIIFTIVL